MNKILIILAILLISGCQSTFEYDPILNEESVTKEESPELEDGYKPDECEEATDCRKVVKPNLAEIVDIDRPMKLTAELTTTYRDTSCEPGQQIYAEANTKSLYTNTEYGFELEIPYNPKWGTLEFKIPVAEMAELEDYEQAIDKIIWGEFASDPHVGCTRPFKILITQPRSIEKALEAYWQSEAIDANYNWGFAIEPTSYTVNNIQMAEYISNGPLCQGGGLEVFTSNFNLYFTTGCYGEQFHNQFKEIAESFKLSPKEPH